MRKIKWQNFIIVSAAACMLAGCSQHTPVETAAKITADETNTEPEMEPDETESSADKAETAAGNEASLADIKSLVGMNDEDTAGLLGGGEENWSNNFYSISVQRTKHSIGKHR